VSGGGEKRRRGRPKGARNKADPPGAKRAREYWRLRDQNMSATAAARKTAEQFGVDITTIFRDAHRHDRRLADEIMLEVIEIERQLQEELLEYCDRRAFEAAVAECLAMVEDCLTRRLDLVALEISAAKSEQEVVRCINDFSATARLELWARASERAAAARMQPVYFDDTGLEMANPAAMLFERVARAMKPALD
jgi:prophage DNA circulation protein